MGSQFWYHDYTKAHDAAYEAKVCCLCDDKPLYMWAGKAYCRTHREVAVAAVQRWEEKQDAIRARRSTDLTLRDRRLRRMQAKWGRMTMVKRTLLGG